MVTFLLGLVILLAGGKMYGALAERAMRPSPAEPPAVRMRDGVDFVPMGKWRNSLIELLNIAGTGPVLGPVQGALFGPVAFLTIPIGCVVGGAFHDYMVGMISLRNNGEQMPDLIRRFLGRNAYLVFNALVCLLMLLVGVVFIYTPGDLFVAQILGEESSFSNPTLWVVYGVIFAYYAAATLFPIDKIIGKIYPVFGAILLLSALGVFAGLFVGGYPLQELWDVGIFGAHPFGESFIPMFFVTVTCGILSGFHSTQATLISRTVTDERDGRMTFYNMMIAEGFIAMTWAAAAMGILGMGLVNANALHTSATLVVGKVAKDMLGNVGGVIAIIGVIVLPITSGDTALRSLRVMLGDALRIDQTKKKTALALALPIFAVVAAVLFYAKSDAKGFNILWRYFSWANESIGVFALAMIAVYMMKNRMPYLMALIPGCFYMYVISVYILNAQIGFQLPLKESFLGAAVLTVCYGVAVLRRGKR